MERLTRRDETGDAIISALSDMTADLYTGLGDNEQFLTDALNKLAAYEDAEEQGRLLVLPCKVGDIVYIPIEKCRVDFHYCPFDGGYGTARCDGDKNCKAYVKERGFSIRDYLDIGKTVFLTREEAEKALEGMK